VAVVVVGATVVVVVVGAVVLVLVVLVLVVDVDASAEPTISTSIVVEVASGVVGDGASAGTAVLVTATDGARRCHQQNRSAPRYNQRHLRTRRRAEWQPCARIERSAPQRRAGGTVSERTSCLAGIGRQLRRHLSAWTRTSRLHSAIGLPDTAQGLDATFLSSARLGP
jgi:hypothetical protein